MNNIYSATAIKTSDPLPFSSDKLTKQRTGRKIALDQVDGATWERFALNFDDINQEQSDCFNVSRWGAGRVERTIVREDGIDLGGAVVLLFTIPGTSSGVAIVKWGPLWRFRGKQPEVARLVKILEALKAEYAERRGLFFTIMPHADPDFGELTCNLLEDLGFQEGYSLPDPDRYLVNVAISSDELRKSLDQKWRYNLKKSLKEDLQIGYAEGPDGYEAFMKMYRKMLARKNFQDTSAIDTLPDLLGCQLTQMQPKIILVSSGGRPTAGAVIDVTGDRAVYLYGATDERALALRAGYAMHWWIAEQLCARPEIKWYDLGGGDRDAGLHQFKKGFTGKEGTIFPTPPALAYGASARARMSGRLVFGLRNVKNSVEKLRHNFSQGLALRA